MLVKHAELATECGVPASNVFVMDNGDVLELTKDKCQKNGRVKAGIILIDSSRNWQINEEIVEERRHIAEDGLVTISVAVDSKRNVLDGPEVGLRGIILPRGVTPEEFVTKVQKEVRSILSEKNAAANLKGNDLRSYLVGALNHYFTEKLKASPLVQVLLHDLAPSSQLKSAPAKTAKSVPANDEKK